MVNWKEELRCLFHDNVFKYIGGDSQYNVYF